MQRSGGMTPMAANITRRRIMTAIATRMGHGDGPNRAWTDIRAFLTTAALDRSVAAHAIGIFALLAKAEAEVHGDRRGGGDVP